jgi:histidinol-phosphatase (PHP family)
MRLRCDYHTHPQGHRVVPYSLELLQPWVTQARQRGLKSLAFTDHDRYLEGIDFDILEQLREQNPDLEILAGLELDNDPETSAAGFRWVEKHWDQLDFVLGSVHYLSGETEMFDAPDQAQQVSERGLDAALDEYLAELEKVIERGGIDCLAHIDLIKIHGHQIEDAAARFRPILELVKQRGLAIEASTAGWRKTVKENYPQHSILELAGKLGIPITTASDAHSYVQVADGYERLEKVLQAANVATTVAFSRHQPRAIPA